MPDDLAALTAAVVAGDRNSAAVLTQTAVDAGQDPRRVLDAMTAAMDAVGRRFQDGEIFVPEMLISARAMKAGMAILEPRLAAAGVAPEHTAVVGTIPGTAARRTANVSSWAHSRVLVGQRPRTTNPDRAWSPRWNGAISTGCCSMTTPRLPGGLERKRAGSRH